MKHQTPASMKFKKFARRLGVRDYAAAGLLEMLWVATQKNAPRGDIGRFDNESIAIELDWEGDADQLVQTMVECGWLDESEQHRLVVHDWHVHAPRYIHGIVAKQGGFASVADYSPPLQSATTVRDCTEQQPNLTQPNLTQPNLTQPNLLQAALVCAEPSQVPAPSEPEQQSRWRFPVRESVDGKGPRFWVMPQSLVDRYEELYGELLDVPQELAKMVAWIEAAGSRRKTASGMQRFCTAWFNRQCDKGTRGSPEPAGVTDRGTSGAIQRYLARANDATT